MSSALDPLVAQAIAELQDEVTLSPAAMRRGLLNSVRRPFVPIRHTFVQQPRGSASRAGMVSKLVAAHNQRALDAILMVLALEPVLEGTPLPNNTWAALLSTDTGPAVPTTAVSKTWRALEEEYQLIQRGTRLKRLATIRPLAEDGSGKAYSRPGLSAKGTTGYFILPHSYWRDGWDQKLSLPAKAMLLVHLSATQQTPVLAMGYEQAQEWYGLSERTAERGIRQLRMLGLLREHGQKVAAARSANGYTIRYHRFLLDDFSSHGRQALQKQTRSETRNRRTEATSLEPS